MSQVETGSVAMQRPGVGAEAAARVSPELLRTWSADLLLRLYSGLRGPGASRLRRLLVRLICRLEGGEMQSATLRRVMRRCHGVDIGAHSYGCFDPVRFPKGTTVGRYVSVGPDVVAYRRNHPLDRLSLHQDTVEDENSRNPEEVTTTADLLSRLDDLLGVIDEREATILRLRYGLTDGYAYTLEEVGRIFSVTRERVRQIRNQALKKMRKRLEVNTGAAAEMLALA